MVGIMDMIGIRKEYFRQLRELKATLEQNEADFRKMGMDVPPRPDNIIKAFKRLEEEDARIEAGN